MTGCRGLVAALLLGCLTSTLAAQGTDRWQAEVGRRLDRTGETLAQQGYRPGRDLVMGELFVGESRQLTVPTAQGTEYVLAGSCDGDCDGLALELSDNAGYQVDVARARSPAPVVRLGAVQPRGPYHVTVTLTGCRVSPCRYGVRLFARVPPATR